MAIGLTQSTLRRFFVALTTVVTSCCPIPNSASWCPSTTPLSPAQSVLAAEATKVVPTVQPPRPCESPTVLPHLSPTTRDMSMSSLIESALLVPSPPTKRIALLNKKMHLCSADPLAPRRSMKKACSVEGSDPRGHPPHLKSKRLMDLRTLLVRRPRKTSKRRNKRKLRRSLHMSTASLASLRTKSGSTRSSRSRRRSSTLIPLSM